MKMLRLVLIGILLTTAATAQDNRVAIWGEDERVYLLHRHLVTEAGTLYSELQVISKQGGEEIARTKIAPLTRLTSVGHGLFVGQSGINPAKSGYGYNYVLINAQGRLISQVLVTPQSGHCSNLGPYQAQGYWYDEYAPLELMHVEGKAVGVITSGRAWQSKCFFPIP